MRNGWNWFDFVLNCEKTYTLHDFNCWKIVATLEPLLTISTISINISSNVCHDNANDADDDDDDDAKFQLECQWWNVIAFCQTDVQPATEYNLLVCAQAKRAMGELFELSFSIRNA